jgi:hypothetical protein
MQKTLVDQKTGAERAFRREQMKSDAPEAMREYQAAQQAIIDRMRRLRSERLAREAGSAK